MTEPTAEARHAVARIAAAVDAYAVGESIARHALAAVPELGERDDKDLEQETIAAAASNVRAVLGGLAREEEPSDAVAPPESRAWVSTLAHRSVGPAAIPRCYCIGQADLDVVLRDAAFEQDMTFAAKWEAGAAMSRFLFGYVEKIVGDLIEHYDSERDRWLRGSESVRTELALAIVEGRSFDLGSAALTLRYDLNRRHLALLVWADPRSAEPPPTAAVKDAATRLARAFGGKELLVVPAGQSVVWAWTTGEHVTDAPETIPELEPGLLGAIGGLAGGADGFRRSHHQARRARRMADLLSVPPGSVVLHRSVALSALLTSDAAAAAEFVAGELGPLSEDTEANLRLRATLATFLEENLSWSRTARRMGVHQNTIMYRVHRAEELLGRRLTERRMELEAALRLAELQTGLRSFGETQTMTETT